MAETTTMVRAFHEAFGVAIAAPPTASLKLLRAALIGEEAQEAATSLTDGSNLEHIAKELADLVYVAYGTAVSLGIDLDEAVRRVHASNMSKRNPDGSVSYREDGKVLKPSTYIAPDMNGVVRATPDEVEWGYRWDNWDLDEGCAASEHFCRDVIRIHPEHTQLLKRQPAGPWVPVQSAQSA